MENLPALVCVGLITLLFMFPMWLYIEITERKNRAEREKAIEAGRHEPVTIQPYVDLSLCMGAGACVTACPEHVLKLIDGQAIAVNMSSCIGHGVCVPVCPVDAIELVFGSEKRGIDIPEVGPGFETNVKGLFVAGELGGMGLIAAAAEQGVQAMNNLAAGLQRQSGRTDVVIVGAGPAGIAAALAAKQKGLSYILLDQEEVGGAVRHYPRKKLVFTRPMDLPIYGRVNLRQLMKEELVKLFEDIVNKAGLEVSTYERVDAIKALPDGGFELTTTKRALQTSRVILALGRRGTPRKLGAAGEEQEKVAYSLLEPENYQYDHLLVVGGGDSAVEAAMQLGEQPGNKVVLSYRGDKINRPKEKNIQRLRDAVRKGEVELMLESQVKEIGADRVTLDLKGEQVVIPNDHVFVMVGGVLPTKFLQAAGIRIKKHFGKRITDLEEDEPKKKERKPEERKPEAPAAPAARDVPTALVQAPSDDPEVTAPRADLRPLGEGLRGEATVALPPPSSGEATVALPPPSSGEATQLLPDLPEDTVPRMERVVPPAVDHQAATNVLDPAMVEAALAGPPPSAPSPALLPEPLDGGYDETPIGAEPEGGRREVTEIKQLRRVATPGSDLGPDPNAPPVAPSAPTNLAEPTPRPEGEVVGRVVAARPRPGQSLARSGRSATPAPAPQREGSGPVSASPAADRVPDEPAGGSALSRGMSRAVGRSGRSGPDTGRAGAPPEARPEARPEPRPGRVVARDAAPEPAPEPASPAAAGPITGGVVGPFVTAALQQLGEGRFSDVRRMAEDLRGLVERSSGTLSREEVTRGQRWAYLLDGEALLGLGDWADAVGPLRAAQEASVREGAREAVARASWALGRALHHAGDYAGASGAIEQALTAGLAADELPAAQRLLGDLALRRGDTATAEARFEEARAGARNPDDQARALRGLAHAKAVQGDLTGSLDLLDRARSLLGEKVQPEVLAGIEARAIELQNVLGLLGPAVERAQDLLAHTAQRRLVDHQAEAMSLLAETLTAVGARDEALEAAGQVGHLARHLGSRGAEARIRAARAACELGQPNLGAELLAPLGELTYSVLDDPPGALLAVRARCEARHDQALARTLATEAMGRAEPLLAFRAARIKLDGALALLEAGSHGAARSAVKQGLKLVQGSGNRGLKLELLLAMYKAEPDMRVVEAVAKAAQRITADLPSTWTSSFRSREGVATALDRFGS
ncbi:MAG: NAD(P)-binding domain-containing protein [Alphaproteobacteria bacterium]|nr:NAD(P)-binding domain-containing protein [Alphaproteobacteria bacterium]